MKRIISDYVNFLGGESHYSGKSKTMYISEHLIGILLHKLQNYKNLPFAIRPMDPPILKPITI